MIRYVVFFVILLYTSFSLSIDVDKTIDELRAQHATMKSIDAKGKLKSGNFIHADFTKLDKEGKVVDGGTLPNHHIKIGEGLFVGDLEKPFINKKIGDIVKVTVEQDTGKVDYSVKINKIEKQILPKVDKDFVKRADKNLKSVEELRNKFKKDKEKLKALEDINSYIEEMEKMYQKASWQWKKNY